MIGGAVLAIWFDVDPADEGELNTWYPRQHLPERLSVPGFLRGRRYEAAEAGPQYFTLYEVADPGVLSSPPYLERLNHPTDWTRRVLPTFRRMQRGAYRRLDGAGERVERHLLTVRLEPRSSDPERARPWLASAGAAASGSLAGVTAAAAYVADPGAASVVTEERRLVRDPQPAPPLLLLLEVSDPAALTGLRRHWELEAARVGLHATVDVYRFLYGLAWL
jgi:hypothetical protein